ncbi:MAG TPA: tRNA preQ1(34) S-adenosylmethionine ribosyltransferase-isomerase QueA [Thermoanaerobaculia bacterium]|nr:tRNA preQ1(34) S-adenosylmethionine ribosyltransferase-isomerase QueA [Thermoanaerobaculia bacterium]
MSEPTGDYDYHLPPERVAQRPAPRGTSRLLVLDRAGDARHRRIGDLPQLLAPGDLLVLNDTRVIPARLHGRRLLADGTPGGPVEVLLVEPVGTRRWRALARPARRLAAGRQLELGPEGSEPLRAMTAGREGELVLLDLDRELEPSDLERLGELPLPPYITRPADASDASDYQTVFATAPGAVAAPTAGLHFTPELLGRLERHGISRAHLTLHVGPGTFRPVTVDDPARHRMDSERFAIPAATAAAIADTRRRGGQVVAVGTTVVRALEAAGADGEVRAGAARTDLFIRQGHRFRAIDGLLTNFHLPRSTLLMLVCALAGRERVLAAYRDAVAAGYRFYSYGDAMLAFREPASGDRPASTRRARTAAP